MTDLYFLPLILAIISRWHGSKIGPNKVVKNLAWGINLGGATCFLLWPFLGLGWPITILSAMAGLVCLAGKSTGHGRGLGLDRPVKGEPEVLEVFTLWALPWTPAYWYKVLILSISGLAAVGGAVLALLPFSFSASGLIAVGGLLKGPGYMVGHAINRKHATVIGEILAGFFAGLGLLLAYILI